MKSTIWLILVFVLAAAWLLWSGHYSLDPLILAFGVLSIILVLYLTIRMDRATRVWIDEDPLPDLGFPFRLIRYLLFLAWKIVIANLHVARLVLDPKTSLEPFLLRADAGQKTAWGQVIYANSITLTPGTITLDLRNGRLLVHALDSESAADVEQGVLDRAVTRLEGLS